MEKIIEKTEKNMVLVRGGKFLMGDTLGIGYENSETPIHEMEVSDFYISKYLVTFDDYDLFCEEKGKEKPNDWGYGRGKIAVFNITWHDTFEYCNWLNKKAGLPISYQFNDYDYLCELYKRSKKENTLKIGYEEFTENLLDENGKDTVDIKKVKGYRLPTEAEWEFAAKGGNYSKGYKYSGSDNPDEVAIYYKINQNNKDVKKIVGSKKPNELGIYDMSGSVSEYCQDYQSNYYNDSNDYGYQHKLKIGYSKDFFHSKDYMKREFYGDNYCMYENFLLVPRNGNTITTIHNTFREGSGKDCIDSIGFRIVRNI